MRKHIPPVLKVSGRQFRIRAVSPEYIRPAGAGNSAAGLLIQPKASDFFPGSELPRFGHDGLLRLNIHLDGGRKDFLVNGYGAARGQRDIQVSQRAISMNFPSLR